jgi:hypothetical protein
MSPELQYRVRSNAFGLRLVVAAWVAAFVVMVAELAS